MAFDHQKIRRIMDAQGRRNDWLAARVGLSESSITRILQGSRPINEQFAQSAADALQIPMEFLLSDEPEPANV